MGRYVAVFTRWQDIDKLALHGRRDKLSLMIGAIRDWYSGSGTLWENRSVCEQIPTFKSTEYESLSSISSDPPKKKTVKTITKGGTRRYGPPFP